MADNKIIDDEKNVVDDENYEPLWEAGCVWGVQVMQTLKPQNEEASNGTDN